MTAGTSQSILLDVHSALPHSESKWLSSLRTFLSKIDATIELDDPKIPSPQRESDSYLMDHIIQSKQFQPAQIRHLNYCRLYLQAVTISDVTTNTGQHLDMSKRNGLPSLYSSVTQNIRVNQDRPSEVEWKLWKKANLLWSEADGSLKQPLGPWLVPTHTQRQRHFAYSFGHRLAIRSRMTYHIHTRRRVRYKFTGVIVSFEDLPTEAKPTEVTYNIVNNSWSPNLHQSGACTPQRCPPTSATFDEYLQTRDALGIDLLYHTKMSVDPYSVCEALANGFCAVSDGSVRYNSQGSFGWVLCTSDGARVVTCMGPARGPRPTSFRAEGHGMLSFLLFLRHVAEFTCMHDPWIGTIATDSQSLLKTLTGTENTQPPPLFNAPIRIDGNSTVLDPLQPDWDVLIEIQHELSTLPEIKLQFIKGHQDRTTRFERLPLLAQLNVEANDMATVYQNTFGGDRPCVL